MYFFLFEVLTMESKALPFFGPSVEFSSVPSIETKKILSYFNQFVSNSVQLLNKFAIICDTKLNDLNFRLQDVEASLAILETKLASIPALESSIIPTIQSSSVLNNEETSSTTVNNLPNPPSVPTVTGNVGDVNQTALASPLNPEILRFTKMLAVGVPLMAVELKMRAEGYDPALLSNNVPTAKPHQVDQSSSDEPLEDSDSD